MDENENYDINEDTNQEVENLTQNVGNSIQRGASNFGQGVKQGFNQGLASANKSKKPEGPEIPTPNPNTPNPAPGMMPGGSNPLDKDKKDDKSGLDKDKKKDDKKGNKKDQDKKDRSNSSSTLRNLQKKDKEKEGLGSSIKKLFGKDKDKKKTSGLTKGLKEKWKALPIVVKLKIILVAAGVILLVVMLFVLAAVFIGASNAIFHSIIEPFVCSMIDPLPEDSYTLKSDYGWRVVEKDATYVLNDQVITSKDYLFKDNNIIQIILADEQGKPEGPISGERVDPITGETVNGPTSGDTNTNKCTIEDSETHRAEFHEGIDLSAPEGTYVYAVQPGTISEVGENETYGKYIIIDHNVNGEYQYSENKTYKTIYGHLGIINVAQGDVVIKQSPIAKLGTTANYNDSYLHFEIIENDKSLNLNKYFGYENPPSQCINKEAEMNVKCTEEYECDVEPETIDRETGIQSYCGGSGMCNGSIDVTPDTSYCDSKPTDSGFPSAGCWCANGVFQYYKSFLPSYDSELWSKFTSISGDAIAYWHNNNSLGAFESSTDINSYRPGALVLMNSKNYPTAGHILTIENVGENGISFYECNYDSKGSCKYETKSIDAFISYIGYRFVGYIYIFDCEDATGEVSGGAGCSGEPMTNFNFVVDDNNKLSPDFVPCLTTVGGVQVEVTAAEALKRMQSDLQRTGYTLKIVSGYRDYYTQQAMKTRRCSVIDLNCLQTANAGASEHQTGLAVDFGGNASNYLCTSGSDVADGKIFSTGIECPNETDKIVYNWLKANASSYGFYLSYPDGTSSPYGPEPWHWRYRG